MIVFPNAKINIGLNVVSKRSDGYHNLETIFYPVKLCDALEVVEAKKTAISFSGIQIDGNPEDNLILKAYRLLQADFQLPPVHFHLHKVIPAGAGLGGGSADAAFALKMLDLFFNLSISIGQLEKYAAQIGADCPFFIQNKPVFATGTGNEFHNVNIDLSQFEIVILKPSFSVSTAEAYKNVVSQKPLAELTELVKMPEESWKDCIINDFEKSVFPSFPQVLKLKQLLYESGAVYASMSGSGSAVFGLFRSLPVIPKNKIPHGVLIYR